METKPDDDTVSVSVSSTGGAGMGGAGGSSSVCVQDCSGIATPPCLQSVCNEGQYQGVVGECVVVPIPAETMEPCDDGLFCTIEDTCDGTGQCMGGPPNDCGMQPAPCNEVSCDEVAKSCEQMPAMNGAACQDPTNLCLKGSMCSNGVCIGGTLDDCFFFPIPDDCHVAECNPTTGMCEAQIGNEGLPCVDATDLCTVGKTCTTGMCSGGSPKDCSAFIMGCFNGVCDTTNGQCFQQPIMPGQQCAEATDQCNIGICDTMGNCNATPANQGMPCNDTNACTSNDLCNNGTCGGQPVTQCMNGDSCYPPSCTIQNDNDCTTSCLGILQSNPSATDGPYQILENMVMVNVYCDMTHGGVTYRELAFGNHLGSYTSYTKISVADLQDPVIQQAFIYLYNLQGGALNNLDTTFMTGNCCIKLAEHLNQNQFLQLGSSYIYPATVQNVQFCNTNYPDPQYRFWLAVTAQMSPVTMPTNYFQLNPATTSTACSNSSNPGWFWRKF